MTCPSNAPKITVKSFPTMHRTPTTASYPKQILIKCKSSCNAKSVGPCRGKTQPFQNALLRRVRFNAFPQNKPFHTSDLALPHTFGAQQLSHAANPRGTYSTCLSHHAQQADRKLRRFSPLPCMTCTLRRKFSMTRRASGRNSTNRFICLPKAAQPFRLRERTASPPLNTGNGAIHWSVNSRM